MTFIPSRRRVLASLGGGTLVVATGGLISACSAGSPQTDALILADTANTPRQAPGFDDLTDAQWAALPDAEWKSRLSPAAYNVLRKEDTERAFTSPLNDEKREGWFACAGCGLILFSSEKKYDSGTGWPSFWDALPGRMETKPDRKLWYVRTEYHCTRCGGHQGHVFDDGPAPTGQRWCNNGVALTFVPASELA